ncbi:winged helix-turn-helix domain-containing protein [Streptomyces rochei]|uniref:winged helix-turn-helix domain-containing protein n=1 Tax=Streptomyces rochei TaxID=1928 RepID=UPI0027DCCC2D|nr:winged helix-turn-helix domain-containing protein [Streptomyces rochei]WMI61471.1 winged helix-turn-helix domain-containing protein [Streptomyces rochei]
MPGKPRRERLGRAVGQHVHHPAGLDVDQHGAVGAALAEGELRVALLPSAVCIARSSGSIGGEPGAPRYRQQAVALQAHRHDPALGRGLPAAEALRDAILNGEVRPGERLPSANLLRDRFGVSSSTVQNALRVLKQESLVYTQLGRGSYVSASVGGSAEGADDDDEDADTEGPDWPVDIIRNEDARPPYAQVADILRREIVEGAYPPGSQLPPAREIQERFKVVNSTAQNAYRSLKQAGLVYAVKEARRLRPPGTGAGQVSRPHHELPAARGDRP